MQRNLNLLKIVFQINLATEYKCIKNAKNKMTIKIIKNNENI